MKGDSRVLRDYALLIALSAVWGSSFAMIKVAVGDIPPATMTAARVVMAFMILAAIACAWSQRLPLPKDRAGRAMWGHFIVLGMLGNGIPFSAIAWGEREVTSSLAAILIGIMPVFTVILAHFARVERLNQPQRLCGLAAGFAGLIVLMGPTALTGLGDTVVHQAAIVLAALSYAATGVYAKIVMNRTGVGQLTLAAGLQGGALIVMIPIALVIDAPWTLSPGMDAMAATAALGLVSTGLASIIYFRLLGSAGPTFTGTVNYLIPAWGVALGVAWLNEAVGWTEMIALVLILGGISLVRLPAGKPKKTTTPG